MTTRPPRSASDQDLEALDDGESLEGEGLGGGSLVAGIFGLEIGNDIDALKRDERVQYQLQNHHGDDSDGDSSESGFSEQGDLKNDSSTSALTGSASKGGGKLNGSVAGEEHAWPDNVSNNNNALATAGTTHIAPQAETTESSAL